MSETGFPACDAFVAAREGGYQNDANDPGNWLSGFLVGTNRGISAPVLDAYLNRQPSAAEMMALTPGDASAIRLKFYWLKIDGFALPAGIDLMLYDDAVNRGVDAAVRVFQSQLGVPVDGIVGPVTLSAAAHDPLALLADMARMQILQYMFIRGWRKFGPGWISRIGQRLSTSAEMMSQRAQVEVA